MEEKITAWVARDERDKLICFPYGKPIKFTECDCLEIPIKGYWDYDDDKLSMEPFNVLFLDKKLFPQVKWEDDEPTKVELTIEVCD